MGRNEQPTETPPPYVESVHRPTSHGQVNGALGGAIGSFQQQQQPPQTQQPLQQQQQQRPQQIQQEDPLSSARTSTSSDTSSNHGSFSLWGRKKKDKEKVQEKESTKEELRELERQRRQNVDTVGAALEAYLSRIPPEAQKALAPLTVVTDNKDIQGSYSIELSSAVAYAQAANGTTAVSPTCKFSSTTRNDIDVTLFFRPSPEPQSSRRAGAPPLPKRIENDVPLEILANSKKGKIKLTIPHRLPGRPLRVICSLESNAYLFLPPEFDGKLAIWAPQGTIELSEPLRRNSTIIPSTSNNAYITVYKITPPEASGTGSGSGNTSLLPPNTMDLAQVNTTKGRVRVEYARGNHGESCLVM